MILREQENVFLFEFDLSYRRYLNDYFDILFADVVYPPGEKLSRFTHFAPIKNFLHVYNVEHPGQTYYLKTSEILKVSYNEI